MGMPLALQCRGILLCGVRLLPVQSRHSTL
uniref:Uncharacterized protein n=1 Tax=Podoviridae sp. ctaNW81 TaxID=2826562 RepID=A0A8S5M5A8_9CAUD|nr:MAG TPA: hypothetical protein [Podoviridae sp. ctaNW81]